MKILGTPISRERLAGIIFIFLATATVVAGRSIYSRSDALPVWVFVVQLTMFILAGIFFVVDYKNSKKKKSVAENV